MELSVSNDFLSLFLPEQSEFKTEEILEEFKIYIFKLMNITVDSLIQEQINNDFENSELKKKYKQFFSEKIELVLNIYKLYEQIIDKTNVIKGSLSENVKIIEKNKLYFDPKNINKGVENIINDIQMNKLLIKDFNSNAQDNIINLLSIPYYMIECFKNKEYDLYLEYYNYGLLFFKEQKLLLNIKNCIQYVHEMIIKLIKSLISINFSLNISSEMLFTILNLKINPIFDDFFDENIKDQIRDLSVYLYEIDLYMIDKKTNFTLEILNYYCEKFNLILKTSLQNKLIYEKIYRTIFELYLLNIIKEILEKNNYNIIRNKIIDFITQIELFKYSPINYNETDEIMKKYFFNSLDKYISNNETYISNYISSFSDTKKFLSSFIPQNMVNNNSNELKFEICLVIYNNLIYINNFIVEENFIRYKDKMMVIENIVKHCNNSLKTLNSFFNSHLLIFNLNSEIINTYNEFKDIILDKILIPFLKDIFSFFQISNEMDITKEIEEYENFKSINTFEEDLF